MRASHAHWSLSPQRVAAPCCFGTGNTSAHSSDLGGVVLLVAIIMRFPLAFGVFVGVECVLGIVSPALSGVCAREGPSMLFLLRVTMFSTQQSQQSPNGAAKYSKSSSPFL